MNIESYDGTTDPAVWIEDFLLPVHAERRDGQDLLDGAMIWNGDAKPYKAAAARVDVCLPI